jgi:glycosyltransferase involved in cell wall biosynthesis
MKHHWVILTGEYPPACGGVGDYTAQLAARLAQCDHDVTVITSSMAEEKSEHNDSGVRVLRSPQAFRVSGLAQMERILRLLRPDRLLVQYTPHAFGYKAMNLPLANSLSRWGRSIAPLWVIFHEVAFPFSSSKPQYMVLAAVTHMMARTIAQSAARIFVTAWAWKRVLRRICARWAASEWLPVPSNLEGVAPVGTSLPAADDGEVWLGHLGAYGPLAQAVLEAAGQELLPRYPRAKMVLLGRGSEALAQQWQKRGVAWADRLLVPGVVPAAELAAWLQRCQMLLQPYPDGVSSRRTTAMAALCYGLPLATNLGPLSEPFWSVRLPAMAASPRTEDLLELTDQLLGDARRRAELARHGQQLYQELFRWDCLLTRLLV